MIKLIDLFCGAGGVTTGFEAAELDGCKVADVLACVNHDAIAIDSHYSNHNHVKHFTEDIRTLDLSGLTVMVEHARIVDPDDFICLWASLECTNFSKAKGGLPRDGDSRTLAEHLFRYVKAIKPEYIMIENVEEFMSWGPLDENGKPISKRNGSDYVKWCNKMQGYGYTYECRILNSADYGAYTSRKRLFIIFAKKYLPVAWPAPTHAKKPDVKGMFGELKKWKAVRDVLNLNDVGNSIFGRKKNLSEKTLVRIYAGLVKFIAGGKDAFLLKYNSINKETGKHVPPGIDEPCPTVAVQARLGVVQPVFISKYFSGKPEYKNISIDGLGATVKCVDNMSLINAEFIDLYYGNGTPQSSHIPCHTIRTKAGASLIQSQFIMDTHFNNVGSSLNQPASTITANRKYPYLVTTEDGYLAISIDESDTEFTKKIKEFMALYGIVDIKMRMLKVNELLKIQGFPDGYILKGTQADQKRFIGNAVEVNIARKIAEALAEKLQLTNKFKVA